MTGGNGKLSALIGTPGHTAAMAYWFHADKLALHTYSIGCGRVIEGTPGICGARS